MSGPMKWNGVEHGNWPPDWSDEQRATADLLMSENLFGRIKVGHEFMFGDRRMIVVEASDDRIDARPWSAELAAELARR